MLNNRLVEEQNVIQKWITNLKEVLKKFTNWKSVLPFTTHLQKSAHYTVLKIKMIKRLFTSMP